MNTKPATTVVDICCGKDYKACGKLNHFQRCCRSQNKDYTPKAAEKQQHYRPKYKVHQVQKQTEQKTQRPDTPDSSAEDDYVGAFTPEYFGVLFPQ